MEAEAVRQADRRPVFHRQRGVEGALAQRVDDAGGIAIGTDRTVVENQLCLGSGLPCHTPRLLETVAMQRKGLAGNVGLDRVKTPVEVEAAARNAVRPGHQQFATDSVRSRLA